MGKILFKYDRKCKAKQLFPDYGYAFKFFSLSLYQKVSVNFSVSDVQPTPAGWVLSWGY